MRIKDILNKKISNRCRFRLTVTYIILGLFGVLGLFLSVWESNKRVKRDNYIIEADRAARYVKLIRFSERRQFNEGIYSRIVLDSVERDYNTYADWVEGHQVLLDSLMEKREPIDMIIIGEPALISSISIELKEQETKYLEAIESYNILATKLKHIQFCIVVLTNIKRFADFIALICIIVSSIIQFFLAWFSYKEKASS